MTRGCVSAALGPDGYLFWEQWVAKGPEQGMKFSWHQDSGYLKFADPGTTHRPYLTCWCTLDDVDESNGTVSLMPHSRGDTNDRIIDHVEDPETHDRIGYDGDDAGMPIELPAGSIACFSSTNLHRSGPNLTTDHRRVYLAQDSSHPILNSTTG